MSDTQTVLAFDFGLNYIGVAVGQSITGTANPVTTLKARNGKPDWRQVDALISEWSPHRLLVGLPLNMDDTESDMSERARAFANRLAERTGIQATLVDERLTSFEAASDDHRAAGADSHAIAAQLIAQTWLSDHR